MANPGSATDMTETPDILHPLSSLEWEERPSLPVEMYDAQAVFLDGTLHVGGGNTLGITYRDHARLYSCKPGGDGSWTATDTPTYYYALTTYDSHLLLVGGVEYPSNQITNKIYTMIDGEFKELLLPMKEKRYSTAAVSSGSVLAVAGGNGGTGILSSVEVYNNGQWTSGQSLPDPCYDMTSVFHGDKWILIGGSEKRTKVYCVSLQSLVSGTEQSPWETLPDVPFPHSATAVFGGRILSIGGYDYPNDTSSIYAYSPDTQSWIHVGDLPTPLDSTCAIVEPSGELMVIGISDEDGLLSQRIFQAFLKGPALNRNDEDDLVVRQTALEIENEYLKAEIKHLETSLSAKDEELKETAKVLNAESDATIKIHQEKVQQLLSEVETLRSQLALPAPVKAETTLIETLEQANRRLNSVVIDHIQIIAQLKSEIKQLRAENDDLRRSLPVKLEPTDPLTSFKEEPEPYYQPSTSSRKERKVLTKTEPETASVTTAHVETLLAPLAEMLISESGATNKMHKEKVQQLLSENQTLLSQLALPAPVKTETSFNLPGVEVVGQTSVMVTNSEQSFHWTGYGFKLHIPQDSLPAGVDRCLLHISASIAGQYQFPDNMELVSAIYWVRCDPPCLFQEKLTVAMQHCAVVEGSTNLSFVRANSLKKELPYYSFEKIEDCGSFTNLSSYGSILLDHFCGVGAVGESPVEKKYCSNVYYLGRELCNREIHFVVMRNHETYITMVEQHYNESEAVGQKPQPVGFRSDSITLDIPDDGVRVKGGWDIQPMMHPAILRSDVDSHIPEQMIPHCQLSAEYTEKEEKVPNLKHKVNMIGAKEPFTYFLLKFDPHKNIPLPLPPAKSSSTKLSSTIPPSTQPSTGPPPAISSGLSIDGPLAVGPPPTSVHPASLDMGQVDNTTSLNENDDTADVLRELDGLESEYYTLGIHLHLPPGKVKAIQKDNPHSSKEALGQVITEWLKMNYEYYKFGRPSWRMLVEGVSTADRERAKIIADNHKMMAPVSEDMMTDQSGHDRKSQSDVESTTESNENNKENSEETKEMEEQATSAQSDDHFLAQSTSRPPSTGEKRRQEQSTTIAEDEQVPTKRLRSEQSNEEQ